MAFTQGLTGSITAPVTGSCSEPAWTASVPNPWTGEGARGGVSIDESPNAMDAIV
jgi:hypothetical protein